MIWFNAIGFLCWVVILAFLVTGATRSIHRWLMIRRNPPVTGDKYGDRNGNPFERTTVIITGVRAGWVEYRHDGYSAKWSERLTDFTRHYQRIP